MAAWIFPHGNMHQPGGNGAGYHPSNYKTT